MHALRRLDVSFVPPRPQRRRAQSRPGRALRLPSRRTVFRTISIVVVTGIVLMAALTAYVYKQSVGKFELRRLSLPTRVFADYTPLKAGVSMQSDDLLEKLDRLGYRNVKTLAQ